MWTSTRARPTALHAPRLRTAADLLRVAGLASLAWALLEHEWVEAALVSLVVGGLVLPRVLGVRALLDVVSGAVLLFAAWSAVLDLYVAYDWLDVVVHALACGLLTVTVHRLFVAAGVLPPPGDRTLRRSALGVLATMLSLGVLLGFVWEVGEWLGHDYLDHRIQVGYDDTMGDLLADGLGALVAGAFVLWSARR
jgi:hypothetical protein